MVAVVRTDVPDAHVSASKVGVDVADPAWRELQLQILHLLSNQQRGSARDLEHLDRREAREQREVRRERRRPRVGLPQLLRKLPAQPLLQRSTVVPVGGLL